MRAIQWIRLMFFPVHRARIRLDEHSDRISKLEKEVKQMRHTLEQMRHTLEKQ